MNRGNLDALDSAVVVVLILFVTVVSAVIYITWPMTGLLMIAIWIIEFLFGTIAIVWLLVDKQRGEKE